MHTLFCSLRSPFARRARLAFARLEIGCQEKMIDVFAPTQEFLNINPLAQVPVLLTPQGHSLPDSSAILEYLNILSKDDIWPTELEKQRAEREHSVWAVGLMTQTVAHFLETKKEHPHAATLAECVEDIERTLKRWSEFLATERTQPQARHFTQADWDLVVALEYADLRMPGHGFSKRDPKFTARLQEAKTFMSFLKSSPPA